MVNRLASHYISDGCHSSTAARKHLARNHPDWARSLRDQCEAAKVPFHFKQWGEWANIPIPPAGERRLGYEHRHSFHDGTDMQRIGTARAGRLLDGILHDAFPIL